jgi:hypothetical protein
MALRFAHGLQAIASRGKKSRRDRRLHQSLRQLEQGQQARGDMCRRIAARREQPVNPWRPISDWPPPLQLPPPRPRTAVLRGGPAHGQVINVDERGASPYLHVPVPAVHTSMMYQAAVDAANPLPAFLPANLDVGTYVARRYYTRADTWADTWPGNSGTAADWYTQTSQTWPFQTPQQWNVETVYEWAGTRTPNYEIPDRNGVLPLSQYAYPYLQEHPFGPLPPQPALTQEEADRRLAAARAEQHRNAIRRQRALKRGRKLLLNVLSEFQQAEYARHSYFTVKAVDGKFFRVRKGGTTHELGFDGEPELSHCIHLPYSYIDEDTLVAIKLMLENDIAEFRRIANTSRIRPATVSLVETDTQEAMRRLGVAAAAAEERVLLFGAVA